MCKQLAFFNYVQEILFMDSFIPAAMGQTRQSAVELLHSYNLARQDGYIVISGPG